MEDVNRPKNKINYNDLSKKKLLSQNVCFESRVYAYNREEPMRCLNLRPVSTSRSQCTRTGKQNKILELGQYVTGLMSKLIVIFV